MDATTRDRIAEIESLIAGHASTIRMITSDIQQPERLERERNRLLAAIAAQQKQVDQINARLEGGLDMIEHHEGEVKRLRKELFDLKNARRLEKAAELQAKFLKLAEESGMTADELSELLAAQE